VIEVKMRYLVMLGIVTAQSKLHLKDPALAGETLQVCVCDSYYPLSILSFFIISNFFKNIVSL
jgi:hypothetical protein